MLVLGQGVSLVWRSLCARAVAGVTGMHARSRTGADAGGPGGDALAAHDGARGALHATGPAPALANC